MGRYLRIFAALDSAGVRYAVVGGVAVLLRGHARMTVDLDLVLDLEAENAAAALDVLTGLGLQPRLPVAAQDFADHATRTSWVQERNLLAFTLWDPSDATVEVDLLASPSVPFSQIEANLDVLTIEGVPVPVAAVGDLVQMKQSAGRTQDLADIEALSALDVRSTVDGNDDA